jgi:hypothetical protein
MKKSYTATFSNGATITRKSERAYTHAWAAFDENDALVTRFFCGVKGFGGSAADAEKAARACATRHRGKFRVEVVPAIAA